MMAAPVMKVLHSAAEEYAADLKKEIFASIGDISHIEVWGQEVLVAAYVTSPFFGNGTMLKGDKDQIEDKWQAKSFLVIKLGDRVEKACKEQGLAVPKVGGWYYGNVQEHWQLGCRGVGAKARTDPKDATKFLRPWADGGWPCRQVLVADIRGSCGGRPQDIV